MKRRMPIPKPSLKERLARSFAEQRRLYEEYQKSVSLLIAAGAFGVAAVISIAIKIKDVRKNRGEQ